jgi:hypothetical protein
MQKRSPEFACLQYVQPGCPPKNIAILLLDYETDSLMMRFIDDWHECDSVDWDILSALSEDLYIKASECGGAAVFAYLKNTLSNTLRMSDTHPIVGADLETELDRLENEYIKVPLPIVNGDAPSGWSVTPLSTLMMRHIVTGIGRIMIAAAELSGGLRGIRRDVRYAVASGSFVVLIVFGGVNLSSQAERLVSDARGNEVGINARQHPAAHTVLTNHNFHVDSAPSGTAVEVAGLPSPSTGKRKGRKRVARFTLAPQRFIPPPRDPKLPELSMMVPPDLGTMRSRAALPPFRQELALSVPPPPYQRHRGFRRILQALVHPFKVLR